MPKQLAFDLPKRVALGAEDFFVSPANEIPYAMLMDWQNWPAGKLALIGPTGCGKSHLARMFQHDSDATLLSASALSDLPLAPPETTCLIVEDMEHLAPGPAEEWLFHAHNHLMSQQGRLLLTATTPPSQWPIKLPDLASRMQATPTVSIDDPDDALLWAVLTKLFSDRQLSPAPTVTAYLAGRIDRSFLAAQDIVARMDAAALATGRELNRGLASDVLDNPDLAR